MTQQKEWKSPSQLPKKKRRHGKRTRRVRPRKANKPREEDQACYSAGFLKPRLTSTVVVTTFSSNTVPEWRTPILLKEKYRPLFQIKTLGNYFHDKKLVKLLCSVHNEVRDSAFKDAMHAVKQSRDQFFRLLKQKKKTTFPVLKSAA